MLIERKNAVRRIKAALKQKTGKTWSVHGDRGTAWGWITVEAPKSRRVAHKENPAYKWSFPDEPPYGELPYIECACDEDRGAWYTSNADCLLLQQAFGLSRKAHFQGLSISPDEREFYVLRAEA